MVVKAIDIHLIKREVLNCIKYENQYGVMRGLFYTHIQTQTNMVMDTLDEYNAMVLLYNNQGMYKYKTLTVSTKHLNTIGAKSGEIIVFRALDGRTQWNAEFPDKTGLAFDYMGAKNELVIVDIKF